VHLICDNYGTHKSPSVVKWLQAHPRFHMHFTPTYSANQRGCRRDRRPEPGLRRREVHSLHG